MTESAIVAIGVPIVTALITAIGALWRRITKQHDEFISLRAENATLRAQLEALRGDLGDLRERWQTDLILLEGAEAYIEQCLSLFQLNNIYPPIRSYRRAELRATTHQEQETQ